MALLALLFSRGAVRQRRVPIPVWGFAPAGTQVDVAFAGSTLRAAADASGRWAVAFPALEAGGPYFLSANASNGARQAANDVLVGEVVLCSGQSNMDMPVSYAFNATAEEAAAAAYPEIRYFVVYPNRSNTPLREFVSTSSRWASGSTAAVAGSFSAVCWFAVRDVADGLRATEGNIALGIIHSALGGKPPFLPLSRPSPFPHARFRPSFPP